MFKINNYYDKGDVGLPTNLISLYCEFAGKLLNINYSPITCNATLKGTACINSRYFQE